MNFRWLMGAALTVALAVVGCGDDEAGSAGQGGSGADGGSGGGGATGGSGGGGATGGTGGGGGVVPKTCDDIPDTTSYIVTGAPPTSSDDCDETLTATGDNDQAQILTAILNAGSNGVVCLEAGEYDMGGTVDVTTTPGLVLKGIGDSPDDVVLEYADDAGDCRGTVGINVSVDNVTIENLWVKNTCENAVVQRGTDGSVFRKVRVTWDGTPRTENGAYGIYPTDCSNTLVEYCQAQGASDAGIYIGKCDGGLVQNNIVYENVAGLEVENCLDVDTLNNEIFDNTGGLLALQQDISSEMQTNSGVRMFDNEVYCNNRENFAQPGSAVSGIPVGTGALSFVGNGIEFFDNRITDNVTLGIGLASNILNCQVAESDCPPYTDGYDPYVKNIFIHDNVFTNNGTDPQGLFGTLFIALGFGDDGDPPVPDVVWDGYLEPGTDDAGICLGDDADAAASILVVGDACQTPLVIDNPLDYINCAAANFSTDQAPYLCTP